MTSLSTMHAPIETRLFINNEFVNAKSGKLFQVINPANKEVVAQVHEAQEEDVELAVDAAEQAFPAWADLSGFQRASYFYKLADLYERNLDHLAWLEAQSMGRPVSTYKEPIASASFLRYIAGKATDVQGESSLQTANFMSVTLRQPYGVCAAIIPWNAPVTMLTFKAAPALIAGNTLVLKSSENAPLTALFIAKLFKEAGFPSGVFNVLSGFGQPCGQALASHMRIRKLSFTGSVIAGKAIKMAAAQSNLKIVTLELGGKSPLVVFDDADVSKAAKAAAASILLNSGQACIASSRVYVHKNVAARFCDELVKAIEEDGYNPVGNNHPLCPTTKRGPQATEKQYNSILEYINKAKSSGTTVLTGGNPEPGNGFYIQPTVFYEVDDDDRLMREEIFGPVQCVNTFKDEQEVLQKANDSEFGLYASVFTRDVYRALRFAKYFQSGNVGVNVSSPWMTHDMPFGGIKQSGEGKELGIYSVREWTELKTVYFSMS
ncbi:aldehyde dehydrogenase [Fusarium napiforme]|uniref:Putative aldehyde dehydrogenase FUS7 n=1 Tax=Fusarium napiforme TaxID=42672 RepID=A0A8H5JIJ1_9HYPO|nr:aldehyde dehydrogenase [Fusarium napiforme]